MTMPSGRMTARAERTVLSASIAGTRMRCCDCAANAKRFAEKGATLPLPQPRK